MYNPIIKIEEYLMTFEQKSGNQHNEFHFNDLLTISITDISK